MNNNCFSRISQLELKQQIDSLNEELQNVREALNNHPDLDPYVKKLISCKHKVTVALNVLQASQDRLNEIRRMVNKEKSVRTTVITEPPPEPEQGTSGVVSEKGSIN
ncbi:SNARE-associated protein Snapin-like [Trichoplusia ni]|uniref:Biogenesis of lysosome-related organelles complex 1 subunit 7 n=1 Tax=Trichoplusia ni TaxID=7111 RepID=A0A7E5WIW8_TRINI|nr:SNARE-associated protein Snapin-like [Trichoplusia ni]